MFSLIAPRGGDLDLAREGDSARRAHAKDTTGREIERALSRGGNPFMHLGGSHGGQILLTLAGTVVPMPASGPMWMSADAASAGDPGARDGAFDRWSGRCTCTPRIQILATADGWRWPIAPPVQLANMGLSVPSDVLYHPGQSRSRSRRCVGRRSCGSRAASRLWHRRYHPMKSRWLPRDVVARAIDAGLSALERICCLSRYDAPSAGLLVGALPAIFAQCMHFGIDMRQRVGFRWFRRRITRAEALSHWIRWDGQRCAQPVRHRRDCDARTPRRALSAGLELAAGRGGVWTSRGGDKRSKRAGSVSSTVIPWQSGITQDPDEAVVVTQNWDESPQG